MFKIANANAKQPTSAVIFIAIKLQHLYQQQQQQSAYDKDCAKPITKLFLRNEDPSQMHTQTHTMKKPSGQYKKKPTKKKKTESHCIKELRIPYDIQLKMK